MNKKLILQVLSKNIYFLIFSIIMTIYFMRDVNQALYTSENRGLLSINSVDYTLLQLKIDVVHGSISHLYVIDNYPLIPIFIGIIYNIYFLVKIYGNKDNG